MQNGVLAIYGGSFGAFGSRNEEQRSCAEDDRAEARSTMAFWVLDLPGEPWAENTSDY